MKAAYLIFFISFAQIAKSTLCIGEVSSSACKARGPMLLKHFLSTSATFYVWNFYETYLTCLLNEQELLQYTPLLETENKNWPIAIKPMDNNSLIQLCAIRQDKSRITQL